MNLGGVAEAGGEQFSSINSQGCHFLGVVLSNGSGNPKQKDHMSYYVYKYNTNKSIYSMTIFIHILR